MNTELLQLEATVKGLKEWIASRKRERITYPLDFGSMVSINKDLLVSTGRVNTIINTGVMLSELLSFHVEGRLNDQLVGIRVQRMMHRYTVNPTTDVFTSLGGSHNLENGDKISVNATTAGGGVGVNPGGLDSVTTYYIINRTGTTFQVSESPGGSAVDVLDDGGVYLLYYGVIS